METYFSPKTFLVLKKLIVKFKREIKYSNNKTDMLQILHLHNCKFQRQHRVCERQKVNTPTT